MRTIFLTLLFAFLFCNGILAQPAGANYELTKAIPPSPEAASLGKYGNMPVGYYTGAPNISIPLYTVQSRDLTVPISLSYSAGGIKVEEAASSVGLGWALSAGGVITRTVRGLPDDQPSGFIDGNHNVSTTLAGMAVTPITQQTKDLITNIGAGFFDAEPDIYYFNFCGHTGKFIMDEDGNCYTIPLQKIKIQFVKSGFSIESWVITTPDGMQYSFGSPYGSYDAKERCTTHNICTGSPPGIPTTVTTGWYLKSIVNPLQTTSINFNYNQCVYNVSNLHQDVTYQFDHVDGGVTGGAPPPQSYCVNANQFHSVRLTSIDFNNGKVIFTSDTTSRPDGMSMVTKILVKGSGNFRKEYRLSYDYLGDPQTNGRLMLDSVKEVVSDSVTGNILSGPVNSYRFQYNTTQLPDRLSYAQDIWGYYNGHIENTTLIKQEPWRNYYTGQYSILPGSNRQVDQFYAQAGILQKITYPTGGSTSFVYESNRQGNLITDMTPKINMYCGLDDPYFSVISTLGAVQVNTFGEGLYNPNDPYTTFIDGIIWAVGADGSDSVSIGGINNGQNTFFLSPGPYHLVVVNPKHQTTPYSMHLEWQNDDTAYVHNNLAGGLRIKQMIDEDPVTGIQNIKNFKYKKLTGDTSRSSGALVNFPNFSFLKGFENGHTFPVTIGYYVTRNGYSNYPLATSLGSSVGYSDVTVEYGNGSTNGKTEYHFLDPSVMYDVEHPDFPFASSESYDWRRGQLLRQADYKNNNNNFSIVSEKKNEENMIEGLFGIQGIKAGYLVQPDPGNPMPEDIFQYMSYTPFNTPSEWSYCPADTTRTYDPNTNNYIESVNDYQYYAGSFPKTITTTNSKNEKIITHITYPVDYDAYGGNSAALGINALLSSGIVLPVEKYVEKQNPDGSNPRIVSGMVTTYKSNMPKPDMIYRLDAVNPITDFVPSDLMINFFTPDSRYDAVILNEKYDSYGNIIQQSKASDIKLSYIWDYKNEYPIAEATNADSANIAATSFEADGKGRWVFTGTPTADPTVPTGKLCYHLNTGNITKDGLNTARIFTVSYWLKNGAGTCLVNGSAGTLMATKNGWSLYIATLAANSSSVTVTGTGTIDELRLLPKDAQMSTYTYEPLLGLTTQCDANNHISYYEYEGFNRLRLIRDQDKNILKKFCYNFAGQPVDCSGPTTATVYQNAQLSHNYIRNNCQAGYTGGIAVYTVYASTYISSTSQADADLQAQNDMDANGQNYANTTAGCYQSLYYNTAISQDFTRNNCPTNYTGSTVTYTVAVNTYSSTVSQPAAQQLAQNDITANGQNYANTNGLCISDCIHSGCTGGDKRCINGICETGVRVNMTTNLHDRSSGLWDCTYVYQWSDCSVSQTYSETGPDPCGLLFIFCGGN